MRVLCIVGMPGSGKSEAVKFFESRGIPVIRMGDVVREEAKKRGYEITPDNLGRVSIGLRKEFDDDEIARRCIGKIANMRAELVVIEGIRSLSEVEFFKRSFAGELYTIAVRSPPKLRFARLKARGRGDDPETWKEFKERDKRELGYGMGRAISSAEFKIDNESDLSELEKKVRQVFEEISGKK